MKATPLEESVEALKLCMESEMIVADFYLNCAAQYTDNALFWAGLAKEEIAHANIIAKCLELVRIRPSEFSVGKSIPVKALQAFISRTKADTEKLGLGRLSEQQAFNRAYHIESTMIELKFIEILGASFPDYESLMSRVIKETAKHRDRLVAKMKAASSTDTPAGIPTASGDTEDSDDRPSNP